MTAKTPRRRPVRSWLAGELTDVLPLPAGEQRAALVRVAARLADHERGDDGLRLMRIGLRDVFGMSEAEAALVIAEGLAADPEPAPAP